MPPAWAPLRRNALSLDRLVALIGPNSENDADRAAPVSIATSALAGCAEDASLLAKHGRKSSAEEIATERFELPP